MRWGTVAAPDIEQDVILFDGDCVLCSHWARFVHRHDAANRFKFTAVQSPYGHALATRFGIDSANPETNLVVVDSRVYFKSDTPLAILSALPGWRWAGIARIVPRGLRNWVYDRIARRRYAWFGQRSQCWAGDPAFKARILERAL
jgi:predicted DCC family thiol-disulfide oxidoreductase YuxK